MSEYVAADDSTFIDDRQLNWTTREPAQLSRPETVLIAPGIMARRRAYNPLARRLSRAGIRTVTMGHETGSLLCVDEVAYLKNYLADKFSEPVHIVGHSLGAIHATRATVQDPEAVSGLLLLQPAGFGGVRPWRALESIVGEREGNHQLMDETRLAIDGLGYALKGGWRFMQTVKIANGHIPEAVLTELPGDVARQAILFPHDPLIDHYKAASGLDQAGFTARVLPRGGHNAMYYRADEVAEQVLAALDSRAEPA